MTQLAYGFEYQPDMPDIARCRAQALAEMGAADGARGALNAMEKSANDKRYAETVVPLMPQQQNGVKP